MLQTADNPDEIRWLPGARFNIAEAALCIRHAASPAIVWADESSPTQLARVSLGQLKQRCQQVAAALAAAGFRPGVCPFTLPVLSADLLDLIYVHITSTYACLSKLWLFKLPGNCSLSFCPPAAVCNR